MAERRARRGQRHRLAVAARADDPPEVARDLVALHATDPSSVYLAAWARMRDGDVGAVERAIYDRRVLIRMLGMRRTVFVTPVGSWASSQYRWSPLERWCPDGMAEWATETAEVELARRWLAVFGPGTAEDLRWWADWSVGQVKRVLTRLRPAEVDLDGATGLVLADDLEPAVAAEPWAALLPPLDSTPMGWSRRDWYLGGHGPQLFDRAGNVGPTVWWDGRIVGGWAHRKDGEIAYLFLEDVGADAVAAVQTAAEQLAARLGQVRITARTRGPTLVEQELTGQSRSRPANPSPRLLSGRRH